MGKYSDAVVRKILVNIISWGRRSAEAQAATVNATIVGSISIAALVTRQSAVVSFATPWMIREFG